MFGKQDKKPEYNSSSSSGSGSSGNVERDVTGYIGKGMTAEGKLSFEGAVRVEGVFNGDVTSEGTLIIGEGGKVEGTVNVDVAIVTGEVKGQIIAKSRVELNAPAKVYGDIRTPNLIVCEGVLFEGNCIMSGKSGPPINAGISHTPPAPMARPGESSALVEENKDEAAES